MYETKFNCSLYSDCPVHSIARVRTSTHLHR